MKSFMERWLDRLPRPLDDVGSIKLKLSVLLLASGAAGGCVLWYGLGMMPPKTTATAAIVALLTSQVLAHGMTSPLRQMTAAARSMARGDYSVRVRATSRDEVGQLAEAFNQMATDLDASDRQRRELIANVSHELRTPVTALQALLENLADGVAAPGPRELSAAVAQTRRLGRLVTELLDVSRLDAGVSPLRCETFDVRSFAEEAIAEATFHSDCNVVLDVPEGLALHADVERLHQVTANLLANAFRHNPPDGAVTVSARRAGDRLLLDVADEGPGIAVGERDRVFERFSRGERSDRDGGTGLGLAIARWIVELHHGRIEVADSPTGCVIRVSLPIEKEFIMDTADAAASPTSEITPPKFLRPSPLPAVRPPLPPRVAIGAWWSGTTSGASRGMLLGGLAVAILGAFSLVNMDGIGLGMSLTGAGMLLVPLAYSGRRGLAVRLIGAALIIALWSVVAIRDAFWVKQLCALAALMLTAVVLATPRRFTGVFMAVVSPPLAVGGATMWMSRGARGLLGGRSGARRLRIIAISAVLVLVFGALFSAADATFAHLLEVVLPDLSPGLTFARICLVVVLFAMIVMWGYIAVTQPRFDAADTSRARPASRSEWAVPLLVLNVLFAVFIAVQARAFFGGDAYVLKTAGLTYAEYARNGFWQLSAVTVLTLGVIAIAAWKASRDTRTDRLILRILLGALAIMSLVVVASALHRMNLYSQAYGLTRLRVWVFAVEIWFAAIFGFVLACGARLRANWLPRAVVASGAVVLLGLAAVNPDAMIAERNIALGEQTGTIDLWYLAGLSADAAPELAALPDADQACVLELAEWDIHDGFLSWNLGRAQAAKVLDPKAFDTEQTCFRD